MGPADLRKTPLFALVFAVFHKYFPDGWGISQKVPLALLTNFDNYVEWFATVHAGLVKGVNRPMPNATVVDLLGAIAPKAGRFLANAAG